MTLNELFLIIEDRKHNPSDESYVSGLFKEGVDRIAQKVGEEGVEVAIASKNTDNQRFVEEMADLWFHSLILLSERNLSPEEIFAELSKRHTKKNIPSR